MICSAARMRQRLLSAAPGMVLGGLCWHAGGAAAALLLCMGISALLPCHERYPYPRKRGIRPHKLFFFFAVSVLLTGVAAEAVRRFWASGVSSRPADLLIYMGAAGFALSIGKRALSLPLPRKLCWGSGALLCALFMILFI